MPRFRLRALSAVSGLALVAVVGLVSSSPAGAAPDIDDVQDRVDHLYHEAEQAQERYHEARLELDTLSDELSSLRADQRRASSDLEDVRDDARTAILRQYAGSDLGAVGSVVSSGDPSAFLEQMSTMSSYQDLQAGLFSDYDTGLQALELRRQATEGRLNQVAELEQQLADDRATVDVKLGDAEELLASLEEEQREALAAAAAEQEAADAEVVSSTTADPAAAPASGRAGAAVAYALSQVGDAYVYGASGPDAFDCSGLTTMAWAQAGVSLPRTSSAQYSAGTRVSVDQLQPGDLVFYYSPISHVGMYIGNGTIVHAANPGTGVTTAPLMSMPYVGAVRPG